MRLLFITVQRSAFVRSRRLRCPSYGIPPVTTAAERGLLPNELEHTHVPVYLVREYFWLSRCESSLSNERYPPKPKTCWHFALFCFCPHTRPAKTRSQQTGSSINPQIPSESNVHAVFENVPLPSLLRKGFLLFLFFRHIWVLYFLGYLGLKEIPHFQRKKKKKNIREKLGSATLNTCKISGSISQQRRGHLDFCAVKCKITAWHRNYLVLVYIRFRALNLT